MPDVKAVEIAEMIATLLNFRVYGQQDKSNFDAVIQEISAALESERNAGYEEGVNASLKVSSCSKCEESGYRRGLEEAAKIAGKNETTCFECGTPGEVIADQIRQKGQRCWYCGKSLPCNCACATNDEKARGR